MEPEQYTGSVIAQLMNLNGNPSFQSSTGPIRVLSDDYLQKTASIALHTSLSFQGRRHLFHPDASQGSRKTKKRTLSPDNDCVERALEEPKNAHNHPIVVKRVKSGIGRHKSSKQHPQITSDFRFAKKQPSSILRKTAANPKVVYSYTDQETSLNCSNHLEEEEEEEEEDSLFLSSSCIDYASPSPISVLEPCLSDNSESTKSDIHGIHLKFLKFESEESNSEESGMMVLSDDENTEEPIKDNRKLMESFGAQGSRDFSYIVDALDEAGFHGNKTLSFEFQISTVIFEILEKKYGDQETWERWERKLLFDRMNVGLRDILHHHHPCRSKSRQLGKRFELWQRREVVEDELWAFLINQEKVKEKEVKMKVAEKVLCDNEGVEWLDLHDEIALFVAEIETSLFREIEAELLVC